MSIVNKTAKAAQWAKELSDSMHIRKEFGLPNEGIVKTYRVKPSGVAQDELSCYIMRIVMDEPIIKIELPLTEFQTRMEKGNGR